jgi:excisionase family DNA binding protein
MAPTTLLTVRDVADQLQLARTTIYRLIQRQEIPAVRVGGSLRIPANALARRLTVREETGEPDRQPAA